MKVPDDFSARSQELAEGIPKTVLERLLKAMLPKRPVNVRRPDGGWKTQVKPNGDKVMTPTEPKQIKLRTRKSRRKAITDCSYRVLNPAAYLNHRPGTWTRAMVQSVVRAWDESDEDYTDGDAADRYLAHHFPKFAEKKIDWNWLAKDVSYIELED